MSTSLSRKERASVRPEQGLLALRKNLGLYANLRPVKVYPCLLGASTLKDEVVSGVVAIARLVSERINR